MITFTDTKIYYKLTFNLSTVLYVKWQFNKSNISYIFNKL